MIDVIAAEIAPKPAHTNESIRVAVTLDEYFPLISNDNMGLIDADGKLIVLNADHTSAFTASEINDFIGGWWRG